MLLGFCVIGKELQAEIVMVQAIEPSILDVLLVSISFSTTGKAQNLSLVLIVVP